MTTIGYITDYFSHFTPDPVPAFILEKEIYLNPAASQSYQTAYEAMKRSKHYLDLAGEQREDGSWGRFHTQDSKAEKRKFATTEQAYKRALELSLPKEDPVVARCIRLMERYVREEESWPDAVEKHRDNGKSHMRSRPFLTAALLNLIDPDNPVIKPKRDVFVQTLKTALAGGCFDEAAWEEENRQYRGPCLNGWNAFALMILYNAEIPENIQRQYLDYLWNKETGIYYTAGFSPNKRFSADDVRFYQWLSMLYYLSGFSLFPQFMENGALPHLLNETGRLLNDTAAPSAYSTRYSENWRDKHRRKNDVLLKILRLLVKCGA